jgi:cytochrome c oxidase assembly factor CtaG/putative copper export protein
VPRAVRVAAPAILIAVSLVALFASLAYGGGADAPLILNPGPVVLYGLPVSQLFVNLGGAGAIGALVLVLFALDPVRPEFGRALDVAAASAAVWTVASAATGFFTFLSVLNQPLRFDSAFGDVLSNFLTTVPLGEAWLATTLIAAGVTVLCFAVRNMTVLFFVTVLAVIGLIPAALQGHRGGTADHNAATSAIFLHVLFAGIWLGGLVCLVIVRPTMETARVAAVLKRYSTLALICFIVVAASGYLSAQIRVETLNNLLSPYGILVLVKVTALLVLGLFGAAQRQFFISKVASSVTKGATGRGYYSWIIGAEIAFMGIASGVAAALAKTATPIVPVSAADLADPTPAQLLTGSPLPPAPSTINYLTLWNFDLIWILICAFAIFFYVAGVWRLHKRGDAWPVYSTVFWILGILLLFYITNGGVNVYEGYLFSAHMLAHMVLTMMIPVLLVPGAPITLALRAIEKRHDGSRGAREWIMLVVHSRVFGLFANPLVASVLFVVSLWSFYYTPLFSLATTDHIGHEWMILHFLIVGYIFVQSLIGVDPSPKRASYPIRIIILFATMASHAFFGLVLISSTGLLIANWYGAMGWDTGVSALADQRIGGAIAWGVGELPTVVVAIVVALMWSRSDARESKRYDRKADRDGDAELTAYNEMLAKRSTQV